MNKIAAKIALVLFQLAGFAEIGSLYLMWNKLTNAKIVDYFLIIWGVYSALWLLTTIFSWKWLRSNQIFLSVFSACGVAMTGGFVYLLMTILFAQ